MTCEHLEAVVAELTRRGCTWLGGWTPHRNDLVFTTFLARDVTASELAKLAPGVLRTGGHTGCYRAEHRHVWCSCPEGRYHVVLFAIRRER